MGFLNCVRIKSKRDCDSEEIYDIWFKEAHRKDQRDQALDEEEAWERHEGDEAYAEYKL